MYLNVYAAALITQFNKVNFQGGEIFPPYNYHKIYTIFDHKACI